MTTRLNDVVVLVLTVNRTATHGLIWIEIVICQPDRGRLLRRRRLLLVLVLLLLSLGLVRDIELIVILGGL
jgi:hypothetical protein